MKSIIFFIKYVSNTPSVPRLSQILLLVFCFAFQALQAQMPDYGWHDANPSATTFNIGTANELAALANLVNGKDGRTATDFADKTIVLTNDIDLSDFGDGTTFNDGKGWIPIGIRYQPFRGLFEGNHKTITGLYINDIDLERAGLFGFISATVQNLGVVDVNILASRLVGAIVGEIEMMYNWKEGVIKNSYTTGVVRGVSSQVGGITGRIYIGSVENCYSACTVIGNEIVGGLVGNLNMGSITSSYSIGAVSGAAMVGGIAGSVPFAQCSVINCAALNTSISSTTSESQYFGRITGMRINNGILSGNVAYSGMVTSPSVDIVSDPNGRGGESRTAAELYVASGFPEAFTTFPWVYEEGKLPGLGAAIEMPKHLLIFDLSYAVATIAPETYVYSGQAIRPEVTVTLNGETLEPSNYNIVYVNNTNAGTATVTVAGRVNNVGETSQTFEINPKTLTISGFNITKIYNGNTEVGYFGKLTFSGLVAPQTATVNSTGVTATYASANVGTHAIAFNGEFGLTGGTANSNNYVIALPVDIYGNITIAQQSPLIIANPGRKTFGDEPFDIATTGGNGTGTVSFTVISGPGTFDGNTLTITGAGYIVVRATKASDGNYAAVTSSQLTITVAKAQQSALTITDPDSKTFGDQPFALYATGGSGTGNVTFEVVSGQGAISGSTLTINGAGNIVVRATKKGDSNHLETTSELTIPIARAKQAAFAFTDPGAKTFGNAPFVLTTEGGTGLGAITFTVVSGAGVINYNNVLTINGAGSIAVQAVKFGGNNYEDVTAQLTIQVAKAQQPTLVIIYPSDQTFGNAPFALHTSGGGGTGETSYTVVSGPGTISGNMLAITGAGNIVVFATKAGDDNFESATSAQLIIIVHSITNSGEIAKINPLNAWTRNGLLHINGLTPGETLSIYSVSGALAHRSVPNSSETDVALTVQGVYIIQTKSNSLKVVFQ